MNWDAWLWLLEDPNAFPLWFATAVGWGLGIGAAALALMIVDRR